MHSVYVYIYLYIQYILHCAFCTDARDKIQLARTPKRATLRQKFFSNGVRTARERALDRAFLEFSNIPFVESHTTFPPYIHLHMTVHRNLCLFLSLYSTPATRNRGQNASTIDTAHVYLRFISSSKFLARFRDWLSLCDSIFARTTGADGECGSKCPFSMRVSLDSDKSIAPRGYIWISTPRSDEFDVACVLVDVSRAPFHYIYFYFIYFYFNIAPWWAILKWRWKKNTKTTA